MVRRRYALRGLVWTVIALIVAAALAIGFTLWKLRADAVEDAFKGTGNVATVLAEQTNQIVQTFDLLLSDVQGRVVALAATNADDLNSVMSTEYGHELLKSRREHTPQADVISIIDADGYLLATSRSWPAPFLNLSDRDYFNHFNNNRYDRGLYISSPVNNRTTGQSTIFFGKPLWSASEVFLGVVIVGITVDQFRHVYETIGLLSGQSFSLLRTDGTVFVHYPDTKNRAGYVIPNNSVWHSLVAKGGGSAVIRSGFFGEGTELVSVRPLRAYPLAINVAISEQAALAAWLRRVAYIGAGAAAVLMCALVLLGVCVAQVRQLRAAEGALAERHSEVVRKSAELADARAQTSAAINNISQGISMFDADQKLVVCNPRYLELYGLSPAVVRPGCTFLDILEYRRSIGSYDGNPKAYAARMQFRKGGRFEHVAKLGNGRLISVASHAMEGGGWVSTHEDVTERTRSQALIAHMASHDLLTGLPNRVMLEQKIDEAVARLKRHDVPFGLVLFDLDGFKGVNDTMGHPAGDALLKGVADRLQTLVRDLDIVARWGGDEFVILLNHLDEPRAGAHAFADRLLDAIAQPFWIKGRRVTVGVSIGIAIAPIDGDDMNELLRRADLALYGAKANGKNRYEDYEPSLETIASKVSARN